MIRSFTPYRFELSYDGVLHRLQILSFLKLQGQTLIFVLNSLSFLGAINKMNILYYT